MREIDNKITWILQMFNPQWMENIAIDCNRTHLHDNHRRKSIQKWIETSFMILIP